MTGSEFRRERLGQERLGLGAKWQYGPNNCHQTISENNLIIKPKFLSDIWQLEFFEILTARAQGLYFL